MTTQVRVNDSFDQGQQRLAEQIRAHSAEPAGYVPQHDQAHVRWPERRWRHGYPIREGR